MRERRRGNRGRGLRYAFAQSRRQSLTFDHPAVLIDQQADDSSDATEQELVDLPGRDLAEIAIGF